MKTNNPPVIEIMKRLDTTVKAITKPTRARDVGAVPLLEYSNTTEVSESIYSRIASNEEILKLFPDIDLAIQIMVSNILAPNDMLSTKLNYSMSDIDIPNAVNSNILDVIRTHVNKNYRLEEKSPTIIREALFTKGAYAEVLIPDTNVMELQSNVITAMSGSSLSTESIVTNIRDDATNTILGDIGTDVKVSLEAMHGTGATKIKEISMPISDLNITFTENLDTLLVSKTFEEMVNSSTISTESVTLQYAKHGFSSFMRKKRLAGGITSISTDSTGSVPLVMKLPVESVLPIHMTSDPTNHIRYIILLDDNGIPITGIKDKGRSTPPNEINESDIKASIIKKASKALNSKLKPDVKIPNIDEIYISALVATIKDKVKTGKFGTMVTVPDTSDVYQIVFSRAIKGLHTKLLVVPKDNLTYFAFDYRDNGTGKSLLEKSIMLFSIRAANLFTRIMANTKNSITLTKVTAELDPNDPDAEHTRDLIINHAMQSERVKYPLGITNIRDFVSWMRNVGYRFDIKHKDLPNISIDVSNENTNIATPDTGLDDMIIEQIIMSIGLKADKVSSGKGANFAVEFVSDDVLFAKRIMGHQQTINPLYSRYVKNILKNDGCIKRKVMDLISSEVKQIRKLLKKSITKTEWDEYSEYLDNDANLTEYTYGCYCSDLEVSLPRVDIKGEDGSMDGLEEFVNTLDTYLPLLISSETFPSELVGDLSDKMDDVMTAIKTVLIKNWMDERNFLPQLTKFLTLDNTGGSRYDILNEYSDFTDTLAAVILPHLKKIKKASDGIDKDLSIIDSGDEQTTGDNVDDQPDDTPTPPEEDTPVEDAVPEDGVDVTEL